MTNLQLLGRLLGFMRPLNGVMCISVCARTVKLVMQTVLIALAAAAVARFVAAPSGGTLGAIALGLVGAAFLLGLSNYIETYTGHYVAFRLLAMRTMVLRSGDRSRHRHGLAIGRRRLAVIADCERVGPFYLHDRAGDHGIRRARDPAHRDRAVVSARLRLDAAAVYFVMLIVPVVTALSGGRGSAGSRRAQGR